MARPGESENMKVTDPICRVEIDMREVVASEVYDGWAYFFCSDACKRRFANSPTRYTLRSTDPRAAAGFGKVAAFWDSTGGRNA